MNENEDGDEDEDEDERQATTTEAVHELRSLPNRANWRWLRRRKTQFPNSCYSTNITPHHVIYTNKLDKDQIYLMDMPPSNLSQNWHC